jgi:hypothetical protein
VQRLAEQRDFNPFQYVAEHRESISTCSHVKIVSSSELVHRLRHFRPLLSRYAEQRDFNPFPYVTEQRESVSATPALRTRAFARGLQSCRF